MHWIETLSNKSVLLMGDSLAWQLSMAMQCSLSIRAHFKGLHTFPIYELDFERTISDTLSKDTYDAVIFSIGTWYNWQWNETFSNSTNSRITPQTSSAILEKNCPPDLKVKIKADPYTYKTEPYSHS